MRERVEGTSGAQSSLADPRAEATAAAARARESARGAAAALSMTTSTATIAWRVTRARERRTSSTRLEGRSLRSFEAGGRSPCRWRNGPLRTHVHPSRARGVTSAPYPRRSRSGGDRGGARRADDGGLAAIERVSSAAAATTARRPVPELPDPEDALPESRPPATALRGRCVARRPREVAAAADVMPREGSRRMVAGDRTRACVVVTRRRLRRGVHLDQPVRLGPSASELARDCPVGAPSGPESARETNALGVARHQYSVARERPEGHEGTGRGNGQRPVRPPLEERPSRPW